MTLRKTDELKIDKDCFLSKDWLTGFVDNIVRTCEAHGVTLKCIKICCSKKKGLHFYVSVSPAIDPRFANYLQLLLGDDPQRVVLNQARIESGLEEWNKLFEMPGRRLRTIYTNKRFTRAEVIASSSLLRGTRS